jgi:peptide/nickel transport system substrate-binding protein
VLVPNKSYWDSTNGGPYLDELELVSVSDSGARLNGLKAGQFDYSGTLPLSAARREAANTDLQLVIPPRSYWTTVSGHYH